MEETIGNICESSFSFDWKIENFSSLSYENYYGYQSPTYEGLDAVWDVLLYPNGDNEEAVEWISVFLRKQYPKDSKHVVNIRISFKYDDKIMISREGSQVQFTGDSVMGWESFLRREKFLEYLGASTEKALTISCTVTVNAPIADTEQQDSSHENVSIPSKPKASLETLARNLKDLYMNQRNCDFTIKVKDQVLTAHKGILGARSSVFAAMFAHDTAENRSGIMRIDDFEPDTAKDLLMYMYTGDFENLSCENVFDLYAISDKYDVQDLKEECLEFMKSKLSLETVCEVLLLAEKYTETELFRLAKNLVSKCSAELLTSDHWEKFASENALLAHKILKMVVLDNSWRIK